MTSTMLALRSLLNEQCQDTTERGFVRKLAHQQSRWSTVRDLLTEDAQIIYDHIATHSADDGFSTCNLKAHYVLDEDFINNGTAFVLFAIVGSDWNYVVRVNDQNDFTSSEAWSEGVQS